MASRSRYFCQILCQMTYCPGQILLISDSEIVIGQSVLAPYLIEKLPHISIGDTV